MVIVLENKSFTQGHHTAVSQERIQLATEPTLTSCIYSKDYPEECGVTFLQLYGSYSSSDFLLTLICHDSSQPA